MAPRKPRKPTGSQAQAAPAARIGTMANPHTRADGVQTRGVHLHLSVPVAEGLRVYAFGQRKRQSEVADEAIAGFLRSKGALK